MAKTKPAKKGLFGGGITAWMGMKKKGKMPMAKTHMKKRKV